MSEIKRCSGCNSVIIIKEDYADFYLEPWPHVVCPVCGEWIPLF